MLSQEGITLARKLLQVKLTRHMDLLDIYTYMLSYKKNRKERSIIICQWYKISSEIEEFIITDQRLKRALQ